MSVLLLSVTTVLAVFAMRQVLLIRLDDQVKDALEQEMRELDRLLTDGRDPATGLPFNSLRSLFETYLRRNVPSNDEAMVSFVNGEHFRSSVGRFPLERLPAEELADWEALSTTTPGEGGPAVGRFQTALGEGHFRVARILLGGDAGAFVVAILPSEESEEIADLIRYGMGGALGVLLLASGVAWLITGRVLAPVRMLTETAGAISQSDLTRRVEVHGTGEAAEMARSFNSMLDRLEAVFQSQREFVEHASHELRDPLTICRGHLELLGDDPDEQRMTIALVMDELDRMGRIVHDLQLLADVDHPDFLRMEWIELGLFAHELTAKASALAPRQWVLDSASDGRFLADRERLTEAVMNLAHNAVQHTLPDESVAIGTSLSKDEVRLWVRDTGTGIPLADQNRIFDRLARGSGAHRRYRGAGLGLAIVKAIAEAHGGRIDLDSRVGEGSTFTIVIPRYPMEEAANGPNPDR